MSNWTLGLDYQRRIKTLTFQTLRDEKLASPSFGISLADFITQSGLTARDLHEVIGETPPPPAAPPEEDTPFGRMRLASIPDDLTGKTVLDVGGYDGFYANLCLERGAKEVVLIDNGEWQNYGWQPPPKTPGIRRIGCDALEWQEPADLVMCFNVIYHVRDPWRFLYHLKTLTRERLLLCTSFLAGDEPTWRVMDWADEHSGQLFDGYYTVFWKPTVPGLVRLLDRTGWANVEELGREGDHIVIQAVPAGGAS